MDYRLKKLEKMTTRDYENRSDSQTSQKVYKQVQFTTSRRNSNKSPQKDDVLKSLQNKPDGSHIENGSPLRIG